MSDYEQRTESVLLHQKGKERNQRLRHLSGDWQNHCRRYVSPVQQQADPPHLTALQEVVPLMSSQDVRPERAGKPLS